MVTCAPRMAAAVIPSKPVPDPSSRIRRRDEGLVVRTDGSRRSSGLFSMSETRVVAAGHSWNAIPREWTWRVKMVASMDLR